MSKDERFVLRPRLRLGGEAVNQFTLFAVELSTADARCTDKLRDAWLARISPSAADGQILRVCISVLTDLTAQGWNLTLQEEGVAVSQPTRHSASQDVRKDQVRRAHLRERDFQLAQPSVRQFVAEMERPRLGKQGWVSIFSLMRDGRELAHGLREALTITDEDDRVSVLNRHISPYLQPVIGEDRCEFTGLPTADIWRYFRHTWTNHYSSIPGRQVAFLVRDAAAENHPIVGIGAFGSAVVQLSVRDEWIGWAPEQFLARLGQDPSHLGPWVFAALDELIASIYVDDFIKEGVIDRRLLRSPDSRVVEKLHVLSTKAGLDHREHPQTLVHKASTKNGDNWVAEARSSLFRSKRAKVLAQLLGAKAALKGAGLTDKTADKIASALKSPSVVRAVTTILRHTKAAHVGVDMLDITVCGAVAPYGPILGGKLVSLLLASPDAVHEYERRYKDAVSLIASSMAGKPVVRTPKLVLLGTTSLYGMASSQYNRLRVPTEALGGASGRYVEYKELGHSTGFGSFHFSTRTLDEIEVLLAQHQNGRAVNSIFGEGVNPKLRKLRSGLEAVGFPADVLLRHGDSRLVYGVALAANFGDVLLGIAKRRVPLVPAGPAGTISKKLVEYWVRRWLMKRIERPGVVENVASHNLVHPVRHGARVVLPESPEGFAVPQALAEIY